MASHLIVTTSDAENLEWALELIGSIRGFPELSQHAIGILDTGMTAEQKEEVRRQGIRVADAEWEFPFPRPPAMRPGYMAMLARPFLAKYFPGFDTLVYLDSDTWVQESSGITDLIRIANTADVAIVPEVHPVYPHLYTPSHWVRAMHSDCWLALYGEKNIPIGNFAVLNTGVFAAHSNGKLWSAWQESLTLAVEVLLKAATDAEPAFSEKCHLNHNAEQMAMNHAIYSGKVAIAPCSALYNWICTLSLPVYDPESDRLVEPSIPNTPIRIIHLTGIGKHSNQIFDVNGKVHDRGMRWRDWRKPR